MVRSWCRYNSLNCVGAGFATEKALTASLCRTVTGKRSLAWHTATNVGKRQSTLLYQSAFR